MAVRLREPDGCKEYDGEREMPGRLPNDPVDRKRPGNQFPSGPTQNGSG